MRRTHRGGNGDDGSGAGLFEGWARGGGLEPSTSNVQHSSYRAELWGVVGVLRCLCELVLQHDLRPGLVTHYVDNESVCKKVLQRWEHLPASSWAKKSCRDLWAEVWGRLRFWVRRGGDWTSSWVKGHADSAKKDDTGTLTGAERGNMAADQVASVLLEDRNPDDPALQLHVEERWGAEAPGGEWSRLDAESRLWTPVTDGVRKAFVAAPWCELGF